MAPELTRGYSRLDLHKAADMSVYVDALLDGVFDA